jgi:hypothetical protein
MGTQDTSQLVNQLTFSAFTFLSSKISSDLNPKKYKTNFLIKEMNVINYTKPRKQNFHQCEKWVVLQSPNFFQSQLDRMSTINVTGSILKCMCSTDRCIIKAHLQIK